MNPSARIRLSILFFFQFFIWSCWSLSLGTWMTKMGFTGLQIGSAYGATSIAAMVSPFFVGMVADRFFAAQRVLGTLHIVGGVLLFLAPRTVSGPGSYWIFYSVLLLHVLCYMPTLALVNSVAFSQMADSAKSFGGIRVFGTFGWIAAGRLIGKLDFGDKPEQFYVGAAVAILVGVYCFFLPNVPPKGAGVPASIRDVLGLDALQLLKHRSFSIFVIGSFLICIPLAFYYAGSERFLRQVGVSDPVGTLTWGQVSEIFFMLVFPFMFARLGVKKMLLLGMACWAARYFLFANGNAGPAYWMLILGIVLHGPCFDFFFVTGQVYVDQQAHEKIRSAAQGFIAFITYGAGMLVGSYLQGFVLDHYTVDGKINWAPTWIIPAVGALGVLILFTAFFSDPRRKGAALEGAPLTPSPEGL